MENLEDRIPSYGFMAKSFLVMLGAVFVASVLDTALPR